MDTIKERAESYAQWILRREGALKSAQLPKVLEGMLKEQKAIDDANLAEVKRQRDEYYDDLLKLRQQKVIDDEEYENAYEDGRKAALAEYIDSGQPGCHLCRKVLIDKACEWLKAYCGMNESGLVQFRRAMEE